MRVHSLCDKRLRDLWAKIVSLSKELDRLLNIEEDQSSNNSSHSLETTDHSVLQLVKLWALAQSNVRGNTVNHFRHKQTNRLLEEMNMSLKIQMKIKKEQRSKRNMSFRRQEQPLHLRP